jgi:hypothetical protein
MDRNKKNIDYILSNDELVNDYEFISRIYISTSGDNMREISGNGLFISLGRC